MLLAPERTTDLNLLITEYERRVDTYRYATDPVASTGLYNHLVGLLARIRELRGYPNPYWMELTPIAPPHT